MKKYVLDTNVLLMDYTSMFKFDQHIVIIPITVVKELDNFKGRSDSVGYNARQFSIYVDKLSKRGDMTQGVELDNGGILLTPVVDTGNSNFNLDMSKPDDRIIQCAIDQDAIIVSNDANVRIIARSFGLEAEKHEPKELRSMDEGYKGISEVKVDEETFGIAASDKEIILDYEFDENEYVVLKKEGTRASLMAQYNDGVVNVFKKLSPYAYIEGRNTEQKFLMDALLNPNIKLVTVSGQAGSGKTFITVASALFQVIEKAEYEKVTIARNISHVGDNEVGFLPGSLDEKLNVWFNPIYDNIEQIINMGKISHSVGTLFEDGILEMQSIAHIRGRSLTNQFVIIDEAQNLSMHEAKTIITRIGMGAKLVLLGDKSQIDSRFLDSKNNGLNYLTEKFKDSHLSAHIELEKCIRSELAEEANERLK